MLANSQTDVRDDNMYGSLLTCLDIETLRYYEH